MPEKLYRIKPINFQKIDHTQINGLFCNYEIVDYQIIETFIDGGATYNVLIRYKDGENIPYVCNDLDHAIQHCNRHWTELMILNFVDEAS